MRFLCPRFSPILPDSPTRFPDSPFSNVPDSPILPPDSPPIPRPIQPASLLLHSPTCRIQCHFACSILPVSPFSPIFCSFLTPPIWCKTHLPIFPHSWSFWVKDSH